MKTRFGKKIVALAGAIAVVLSLLPSALPVMAESSGDEPAAQNAANAPLIAQSGTATPENALSDEAYKDFGFRSCLTKRRSHRMNSRSKASRDDHVPAFRGLYEQKQIAAG